MHLLVLGGTRSMGPPWTEPHDGKGDRPGTAWLQPRATDVEGGSDSLLTFLPLDTALSAPAPRRLWEASARSRPGVELIPARAGVVRSRRASSGPTVVIFPERADGPSDPVALTFDGTGDACPEVIHHLAVAGAVLAGVCVQAHVPLAVTARPPWGTADATSARVESHPDGLISEVPNADLLERDDAGHLLGVEHPARWAPVLGGSL